MTSSTADDDPPQRHHNSPCIDTLSPTTRESIAVKEDIHGIESTRYPNLKILREIPTRISHTAPTANAVDRHDDDDNVESQTHPLTPHLSPNKPNSNPFSTSPATNNSVTSTLDKINEMMRSWSSHPAFIQAPRNIPCPTPHHPSSLPPSESVSVDERPFDVLSTLKQLAESVNQPRCRIAANLPSGKDPTTATPHSPAPHRPNSSQPMMELCCLGPTAPILCPRSNRVCHGRPPSSRTLPLQ